jgi:hypothetical protein
MNEAIIRDVLNRIHRLHKDVRYDKKAVYYIKKYKQLLQKRGMYGSMERK